VLCFPVVLFRAGRCADSLGDVSYPPPIHTGATGETTAWARPHDGAADIVYWNGNRCRYLARGDETGGTYGLYEWVFAGPVSGPDAHFHRTLTESFFVLEGTVTIYDGREWGKHGPGDFVHVPAGGIHGFRNEDGAARMLLHFAPGAPREGYFEGLAAGLADLGPAEVADFMAEHDNHWLGG
jgi:mannose-6-phosphate isomerase-like protein (cupin superfamily)